jgi:hypothetical protein
MATAIDNGSTHLDLSITIEPLFAQHGNKCGKERCSQTRIKDGPDVDNIRIWAIPWGECGIDVVII